jgi:CHAT domain-containing protein
MGLRGQVLRRRYERDHSLPDLADGITSLETAASLDVEHRPAHLNTLTAALLDRYEQSHTVTDLDRAIEVGEESASAISDASPDKAVVMDNLARCRKARYERTSAPEDLQRAIQAYRDALQAAFETDPERALVIARNWLVWAMDRCSWVEAAEASDRAAAATDRLYRSQLLQSGTDVWLSRGQGLAAAGAYALVQMGRNEEAVLALERDRARALNEALERDRAPLETVATKACPDLVERYTQAVDLWNHLRTADFAPCGDSAETTRRLEAVRKAHRSLEASIAAVRQVPGCEAFLEPPDIADVRAASRESQLVYVLATTSGGCALVVPKGGIGQITSVPLPTLTESNLRERLQGVDRLNPSSYLMAYGASRDNPEDREALVRWFDALEAMTRWLWEIMGPIMTALNCGEPAILIPTGGLGLLPLHAAWTEDPAHTTGRCYAMDIARLRYAPNARMLLIPPATFDQPQTLLVVQEPQPVTGRPLPNADGEAAVAAASFPNVIQLPHEKALCDDVLRLLPECVFAHFACHGAANFDAPLESSLVMANDDLLTVRQLVNLHLKSARLAVLSACEAGIPGPKLPDQVIGLPAGFLQAGFVGVIAPLWFVDDSSTAMLMVRFYMNWRGADHLAPMDALLKAQAWVRDTTNAQKILYFRDEVARLSSNSSDSLSHFVKAVCAELNEKPPEKRDYANPFYWAGFEYIGS